MVPSSAFDRSRGISPLVGVVLLVAIVVILASTVGVFVLGLAQENRTVTPTVVLSAAYEESNSPPGDSLTLTMQSGDPVETARLEVRVEGAKEVNPSGGTTDAELSGDPLTSVGTELQAGERFVLDRSNVNAPGPVPGSVSLDLSDATVRLVWADDGTSDVLWTWTAQ